MRKLLVPAILAALVIFAGSGVFAGDTKTAVPDKVTIDDCVVKRSAVEFPHGAHAEKFACDSCHHTSEGLTATSAVEVATCGSCHTSPEVADTPKCAEMSM